MSVCVLGGINWDVVTHVEDLPRRGETIHAHGLDQSAGGKGLNQAVAAARYGAEVILLGATGDDVAGGILRRTMRDVGVDDTMVASLAGVSTGQAQICLARNGDNMIVVNAGANARYSAADVRAASLAGCTVFVTQFEAAPDAVEALFLTAPARAGIRILNAAPALEGGRRLFALADIVIVNETELQSFANLEAVPATPAAFVTAARSLINRAAQTIVVTLGPRGCLRIDAASDEAISGYHVEVVDTIGAGDCFCGVLGAALAEGRPLGKALRHANAAAALSVGRPGAAVASPTRLELEDLLRRTRQAP